MSDKQHQDNRSPSEQRRPSDQRKKFPPKANLNSFMSKPLDEITYSVFDIESTGGNPERNAITEICALKVVRGEVVDKFYSLVNPRMPIPPIVRRMTGIDNKMVRNAPGIEDVMPGFADFVKDTILVSHNTIGDMKFLQYYSHQVLGQAIDNFFLCTHLLVERLVTEAPNRSLKGLAQHFAFIPKGDVHRADADAYLTLDLFKELYSRFPKQKIISLADAIRFQGDYESGMRLGWAIDPQTIEALPQTAGVFELYDRMGRLHFASSALNIKRDVKRLLKYQQVPKPLLRLVLTSYDVKFRESTSHFAAVYDESKVLSVHRSLLKPSIWHQRTVPAVCLTLSKAGVEMTMGDLSKDVFAAFGPIADRKELGKTLARVVEAAGGEGGKRLLCNAAYKTALSEFFAGRIEDYEAKLVARYENMFWRFLIGTTPKAKQVLALIEKLKRIKLPSGLVALSEMKGLIMVRSKDPSSYDLYRLKFGRLSTAGHFKGSIEAFSKSQATIRRQLKLLRGNKGLHAPLTHAEAMHANAIFWWVLCHSGGQDGYYYSDAELAAMASSI